MKEFMKMLAIFILILLPLSILLDGHISRYLRNTDVWVFDAWNDIYKNELTNDVIVLGASNAWRQFNPSILDSILNTNSYVLAVDGSPIDRQILKYKTYCRVTGHKPEVLIQNIEFGIMYTGTKYLKEQFFPYLFSDLSFRKDILAVEDLDFFELFIPCYRYYGYHEIIMGALGLYELENHYSSDKLYKGYCGSNDSWNGTEYNKLEEINYACDTKALELFDEFLSDVQKDGTKIVFVYAPMYIGTTNKINNIEGMYEMYNTIASKHCIPILDYNNKPYCYDTSYFYNATHMNKLGAQKFSVDLAHDLDSLNILSNNNEAISNNYQ